jgi:DNA-binding MarR family transcriptional regulator
MQANMNTSAGFQKSGFSSTVKNLLKTAFPNPGRGGIVCCIDNLELLEESERARKILEELRDVLLQVQGLCWVLCGALGITYGVAASPRLESFMYRPIEIKDMDKSLAPKILERRIEAFSARQDPYLPINMENFDELYEILKGNLRTVLSYTDNFCQEVSGDSSLPKTPAEKSSRFHRWLNDEARAAYQAARAVLTPTTIKVFDQAAQEEGTFSPSDFEAYGFKTMANFRPYIKNLEDVNLVVSTQDDTDKRRKTIQITPKGWLVRYHQRTINSAS